MGFFTAAAKAKVASQKKKKKSEEAVALDEQYAAREKRQFETEKDQFGAAVAYERQHYRTQEKAALAKKLGVEPSQVDQELSDIAKASKADVDAAAFDELRRQRGVAGVHLDEYQNLSSFKPPGYGRAVMRAVRTADAGPGSVGARLDPQTGDLTSLRPPGGSAYIAGIRKGLQVSAQELDSRLAEPSGLAPLETDDPEEEALRKKRQEIRDLLGE